MRTPAPHDLTAESAAVDLMVTVYQRTYSQVLRPGFFRRLEQQNQRAFQRRVAVVNNVDDPTHVKDLAQPLLESGELDELVWVAEQLPQAMRTCGWRNSDFGGNPHYSDWALVAVTHRGSRWLLCWDAEVTLVSAANWIDPSIELLCREPGILTASPDWGDAALEAEAQLDPRYDTVRDNYHLGYGFSDQVFLVDRERLAQPIYHYFCPASWRYPCSYLALVFEARVDAYMRRNGLLRASFAGARYRHPSTRSSYPPARSLLQRFKKWRNRWALKALRRSFLSSPTWRI